ncbi:hypothetical protein IIB34_03435 [PVC group bacterium]|nr:hypothetical protein [PVC group bacterium]
MVKPLIFTDKEIRFLQELIRNKVKFVLVGLSAATLQGVPAVTQDIDIWFSNLNDPGLRKALKKVDGIYVPPTATTPPMLAGDNVDLFDLVVHMHGLHSFAKEYKNALDIPLGKCVIKVLPLDRIIASKKATARDKDLRILPVLCDALIAINIIKNENVSQESHAKHRKTARVKRRAKKGSV